jgi:mRNA-degrading endonuclease RelE of RelBE toxin-antitoxin system
MEYKVVYSNVAVRQLRNLRAFERSALLDQIERILQVAPTRTSKTTVKRLREPAPTGYRLRVGEFRVFYDVEEDVVAIVQILSKEESVRFLGESQ